MLLIMPKSIAEWGEKKYGNNHNGKAEEGRAEQQKIHFLLVCLQFLI